MIMVTACTLHNYIHELLNYSYNCEESSLQSIDKLKQSATRKLVPLKVLGNGTPSSIGDKFGSFICFSTNVLNKLMQSGAERW